MIKCVLTKCPEMSVIGRPDIFVVGKQACSCSDEVDESMRQKFSTFDLLHS